MKSSVQHGPLLIVALFAFIVGGCDRKGVEKSDATGNTSEVKPSPKASPAPTGDSERSLLALSTDGLLLIDPDSGVTRQLIFGSDQFEATQNVGKAIGNFTGQAENPECGAGPLTSFDYPGGLTLFFQDKKFIGWDFDGQGKFATPDGIGIGSKLGDMRARGEVDVQDSSIGHEFSAGDLHGLFDAATPAGKVTNLWAGTTCIAR